LLPGYRDHLLHSIIDARYAIHRSLTVETAGAVETKPSRSR
jgi:hypothetical protein